MQDFGFGKMGDLLKAAQQIKVELARIKEELKDKTVEASAGGGMVKVTANGHRQILSVSIEKEVVDPEEREVLEDLVVAPSTSALCRFCCESRNFKEPVFSAETNYF